MTETFTSDGGGGNTSPIAEESPYIDIFGSVYRLADPSVSPSALTVHVGDSGSQTLTITNLDVDDGYSENLIATVVGTTGAVTVSQATTGDIKPLDDATIGVNFSTSTPGQIGSVTLDLKSDGAGIDGLGMTDLGDVTIPIVVTSGNDSRRRAVRGAFRRRDVHAERRRLHTQSRRDQLAGHGLARRAQ